MRQLPSRRLLVYMVAQAALAVSGVTLVASPAAADPVPGWCFTANPGPPLPVHELTLCTP